jgi:pyruvate dehydrogenase E2 component (dihydrolipoamide acetyltransferase)
VSVKEFALPDLGEGLTESEVVAWKVAVGDTVELNQIIAEVETAKALVEVPSPFAGVVHELHAEPGQTLEVGAPLMSFDVSGDDGADTASAAQAQGAPSESEEAQGAQAHGVASDPEREAQNGSEPETLPEPVSVGAVPVGAVPVGAGPDGAAAGTGDFSAPAREERHEVLVGRGPREASELRPRRRARTGRLAEPVEWSRPAGVGTRETWVSVPGAQAPTVETEPSAASTSGAHAFESEPVASGETRAAATGVRRRTAQAMVRSAAVPQVTEFLTVDVTKSIRLLERLGSTPEFRGRRLTVLTLAAKALCLALAATPDANSRWDEATNEIVTPSGVNLGIAVASERGLVVPNIRGAQALRMPELADAIAALVETARAGRTTPAELTGGSITITNVGVFGVDAGTPLLNPGESAILALGAVNRRPWEHKGEVRLRRVMTLSLTFDHRVIDGEQGSRLLRDIGRVLSDPASAITLA